MDRIKLYNDVKLAPNGGSAEITLLHEVIATAKPNNPSPELLILALVLRAGSCGMMWGRVYSMTIIRVLLCFTTGAFTLEIMN